MISRRSHVIAAVLAIGAMAAAGCGGSGIPDKAGGQATPITLRLATQDRAGFPGAKLIAHFADDVRRLSGGSIRIVVTYNAVGDNATRFDQRVADLVRSGRTDLASVPSRAWDVEGVRSLRALQTPFLLTTQGQLTRVTADARLVGTMLAGLRPLGVTGLALVPESLRHPFAFNGTLRSLRDFAGAGIRAPRSDLTWTVLRALGARPVDLGRQALQAAKRSGAVKGAESDLALSTASLAGEPTTATSNITLFPRVDVFVVNAHRFAQLTAHNREVLRRAASDTAAWAPHADPAEATAARAFCRAGGRVVTASAADLRQLVKATRRVTSALERDPATRSLVAEIRTVAGPGSSEATAAPTCSPAAGGGATAGVTADGERTPIDGTYRNTVTVRDYLAAGVNEASGIQSAGIHTIVLHNGRLHDTLKNNLPPMPCDGTYTVRDHTFTFAWDKNTPCTGDFTARWSLSGGELRFTSIVTPDLIDRTLWGAHSFRKIG